ncbi:MAG: 30S ribosomal protein S13 [Candidatus Omnitrophota bacterium]
MPRVMGVDIPREKRIEISLRYVHGVGQTVSRRILDEAQISYDKRAKDLSDEEVARISTIIQKNFRVEGDLKREVTQNIKRLIDTSSYRGSRHKKGLPSRGQRTKTNARTRKGKRRMVGTIRKEE